MREILIFLGQVILGLVNFLYLTGELELEVGTLVAVNGFGLTLISAGICGYLEKTLQVKEKRTLLSGFRSIGKK